MNILLVEDERRIADFVCQGLSLRGMTVQHCDNGHTGYAAACAGGFDLLVLDIMLPGRDGLSVLKALRERDIATPVILLTARNELGDRVKGLELGADDYLAKPFYVEELAARTGIVIPRVEESPELKRARSERQSMLAINRVATEFFRDALLHSPRGAAAHA